MMTDDELSELEEFIDQRCRKASKGGMVISPRITLEPGKCCPLGAASRRASVLEAARSLGLSIGFAEDFAWSFDRETPTSLTTAGAAMGRRFRERVIAGDYR